MFNFLNSESLWIGTDVKKFNEIRTQLEQEGIPYKYKTKDHLSQTMYPSEGTLRSRTGSFGNKPDQMIEYEILVHKKDYEKVRGNFWFVELAKLTKHRNPIVHICDFSRCALNVRLCARIQHLLRDQKYGRWDFDVSDSGFWSKIRNHVEEIWGFPERLWFYEKI